MKKTAAKKVAKMKATMNMLVPIANFNWANPAKLYHYCILLNEKLAELSFSIVSGE
jgi:hypothetical protein